MPGSSAGAPASSGDTAMPSRDCRCVEEKDLTSDNRDKALRALSQGLREKCEPEVIDVAS